MRKFLSSAKKFVKEVISTAYNKVKNFAVGMWHHAEGVTLLVLASFGLTALLSELPFLMSLPLWIEGPLVIPAIAVLIVLIVLKFGEWRLERRAAADLRTDDEMNWSAKFKESHDSFWSKISHKDDHDPVYNKVTDEDGVHGAPSFA